MSMDNNEIVTQLVARQAATAPNAIALIDGHVHISYKELNQRANQLAHMLQELGVQSNVLVGICLERSIDLVVGLLGILKAGGVYVPLDPTYPQERLKFMLEDARVSVLVTQRHIATSLPVEHTRVLCLDSDSALLAQQSITNPISSSTADDLAYVIYTSGSTGRPKGVQITHSSLLNLVSWHQQAFEVTASDHATHVTSPAFDATGWELWPYLTIGASISLPDEDTRADPVRLRDWLLHSAITITFLPTALAERLMVLEWPAITPLRFLLTGADALHHYPSPDLPFALINNYGPTEATVVATSGRVSPVATKEYSGTPPSIGRPIANTQVYILDEQLRPVPTGERGELYIGGAGLAIGYLNRPDLTAEKFIRNPFSDDGSARLYKTGDIVRYLPDGQIAFMGREDHQIKLRGYRIEPGEIVAVLNARPDIETSFVMAREDTPGDKKLVAYVVPFPTTQVTLHELQDAIAQSLPDYMMPATFVLLDSLPVTANGKIDRTALPRPDSTNTLKDEAIMLPTTTTEIRVAEIVCGLLNIEEVGVDENFFMLGGNSLLGAQIIIRIATTFGVELKLHTLFSSSTVRLLAEEIERAILIKLEAMSDEDVRLLLEQG